MMAWERQPGESAKAFEAFKVYRDLGPGRSLDKAAAIYYGWPQEGSRRATGTFNRWSREHAWVERAATHDGRDDMIRREAVDEHLGTRISSLEERKLAAYERMLDIAETAIAKEAEMLDAPLYQTHEVVDEDTGEVTRIYNPAGWNFNTVARLHAVAERALAGIPSFLQLKNYDLSSATDEQLERVANGEDPAAVLGEDERLGPGR